MPRPEVGIIEIGWTRWLSTWTLRSSRYRAERTETTLRVGLYIYRPGSAATALSLSVLSRGPITPPAAKCDPLSVMECANYNICWIIGARSAPAPARSASPTATVKRDISPTSFTVRTLADTLARCWCQTRRLTVAAVEIKIIKSSIEDGLLIFFLFL